MLDAPLTHTRMLNSNYAIIAIQLPVDEISNARTEADGQVELERVGKGEGRERGRGRERGGGE